CFGQLTSATGEPRGARECATRQPYPVAFDSWQQVPVRNDTVTHQLGGHQRDGCHRTPTRARGEDRPTVWLLPLKTRAGPSPHAGHGGLWSGDIDDGNRELILVDALASFGPAPARARRVDGQTETPRAPAFSLSEMA